MRARFAAGCGVLALGWPACALSSWLLDAEAGWMHDSNLPRAQLPSDVKGGSALSVSLSGGYFFALDERNGVTLSADARAMRHLQYSGLDLDSLGGTVGLKHKLGLGPFVPWVSATFSGAREHYRTAVRDSDRYVLTLAVGRRFTDRLEGSLGAAVDRRYARHPVASGRLPGDTFELSGRSLFARGSYALAERVDLTLAYSVRSGDVVSSTRRNFQIFRASAAISPDPAFGPDYFAYRIKGVTRAPAIGVQWALAEYSSLQVVYSRELTHATGGLNYYSTVFNVSFLNKF